jgi:hypothetical protein
MLIRMPPLLADLICRALESRGGFEVFVGDVRTPPVPSPDVVIVGPDTRGAAESAVKQRFPQARIVSLAADLVRMRGPDEGDERELTLESLLESLCG